MFRKVTIRHLMLVELVLFAGSGTAPDIQSPSSTMKVIPGKKVYMACVATGDPSPSIAWERDGTTVSAYGSRFSVNSDTNALRIFNARLDDHGNYTCIAKNPLGVDTLTVSLLVLVQPESKIISPTNFTFMELTNQEIVCRSRGLPQPSFEWLTSRHQRIRPMKSASHNMMSAERLYAVARAVDEEMFESVLFLQPVTSEELGSVVCVAVNEIGTARDTATLDVLFPPKVLSTHKFPQDVTWWQGHSVNLTCMVTGNSLPEVTWTYNGRPFQCTSLKEWVLDHEVTSTCMITSSSAGGPAVYRCSAENRLGKLLLHEFHVQQIFTPPPVTFRPMTPGPDELLLSVKVGQSGNTPLASYVLVSYRLYGEVSAGAPSRMYERMADFDEMGETTVALLGILASRDYLVCLRAWNMAGFGPEVRAIISTDSQPSLPSSEPRTAAPANASQTENNQMAVVAETQITVSYKTNAQDNPAVSKDNKAAKEGDVTANDGRSGGRKNVDKESVRSSRGQTRTDNGEESWSEEVAMTIVSSENHGTHLQPGQTMCFSWLLLVAVCAAPL